MRLRQWMSTRGEQENLGVVRCYCHVSGKTFLRRRSDLVEMAPCATYSLKTLFVAADVTAVADDVIAEFAHSALRSGMVYLCAWGPDCGRLHDLADQVIVQDDQGERLFAGPSQQNTIMTTLHEGETLNQALEFFVMNSYPTDGFEAGSNYWLAISVGNPDWATTIKQQLEEALK